MPTVQQIIDRKDPYVVHTDRKATVLQAITEMNARRVGAVVVLDQDKVVGIFSERDVLVRVVGARLDPTSTLVEKVMTTPVACCLPETTLDECKGVMTEKRIRHLPVVKENRLVGIVTSGDVMAFEKAKRQETIRYLREYIYGPFTAQEEH